MNYSYQDLVNLRLKVQSDNPNDRLEARNQFDSLLDFTISAIEKRNSDLVKIHSLLRDIIANQPACPHTQQNGIA